MLRKLFIASGYLAAAAIVIGGTILLVAYGNGYSYDFKAGRLVHRGLVILDSTPGGATVTLGDKELKAKTPYRQTFEGGEYDFTLTRQGFRTWHKRIEVRPAKVSLGQYVILLPQHIPVETVVNHSNISEFMGSRDRRRIAFNVPEGNTAGVWSLDTGNRNQTKLYALQPNESIQILSWSDDNSHLLVKQTLGAATSLLVLAANGNDAPINLTTTFGTDIQNAVFNINNWRELYWQSPEGLRRLDLGNQTVSPVLVEKAAAFTFAGDRILYVDVSQPTASLWSLERNGRKQVLVKTLPPSPTYALAYSTYINTPQAVVMAPGSNSVTLYSDLFSDRMTTAAIPAQANSGQFNGDGRFILMQTDSSVATYDLELGKVYTFPEINSRVSGLSWFDNYHVQFNRNGQIVMAEYDSNYAIAVSRGNLPPFNSQDNKWIYTTSKISTGASQVKAIRIRQ